MKVTSLRFLVLMFLIAVCSASWAERLPSYYPPSFQNVGVVDALNSKRDNIVIGDVSFHVSKKTKVHGLNSKNVTLGWVAPGSEVGFVAEGNFITEIWVLPKGYKSINRD